MKTIDGLMQRLGGYSGQSWRSHLLLAAGFGALSLAAPAYAQEDAPDSAEARKLPVVIVTSDRQEGQSIQSIPMAISAIDTEALTRTGQSGLEDYTRGLPSVSLQQSGPGRNKIDIRGITTGSFDFTDAQDRLLVSVYLDDVPISLAASNPELKVLDLERIEVIRGPQGTLYGAGSMSGTIRLLTQKPDATEFFGDVQTSVSTTNEGGENYSLRGMVNLPIVEDVLALRLTGYTGEDSGYVDNLATGEEDANSVTNTQFRGALRFTPPNSKLTLDASALYLDLDANALPSGYMGLGDYKNSIIGEEGYEDEMGVYNLTAQYDLGFADLTASASYVDRENYTAIGGNQYLLAQFFFGELIEANIFLRNDITEWDYEARLVSKGDGPLQWSTGIFYQDQSRDVWQNDPSDNFDDRYAALLGLPPGSINSVDLGAFTPDTDFSGLQELTEQQIAIFGEATYSVTDKLDITAGLRYFDWQQDFSLYFGGLFGVDGEGVPLTTTDSASTDGINPRVVVSYDISDDVMLFAEAAKGFRYGGVNQPLPLSLCGAELAEIGLTEGPATFGADSLWSYSVGEKGLFFDGALKLNATAFMIDWEDVQTKKLLPSCAYYYIQNDGEVRSMGVEIEAQAQVTENLSLGFNGSFTEAEANGDIPNLSAEDGDPVPYFPGYLYSFNALYERRMGPGDIILEGTWSFRDSVDTQFNTELASSREIPSSDYLSIAINYQLEDWEFGIFGNNLTEGTDILLRGPTSYPAFQPGDTVSWARPRTIGARVRKSF